MKPHLCHVFPSFGTGGPEVRTAVLMNAAGSQFRHTIVSLSGELAALDRLEGGLEVVVRDAPRRSGPLASRWALAKLLKSIGPDLLLTYGWGGTDAVVAARLSGLRRIIHAEDGFLPDEALGQKFRRLVARRFLLRLPARVVVPSQTLADIARWKWRLPENRLKYLPNGIDVERFAPATPDGVARAKAALGLSADRVVIGTVAALRREKNHARLIRGFAGLANHEAVRLLIVGGGPEFEALQQVSRELSIADRVIFTGDVVDPVPYYHAMDVFALSSDTEQMPISLLEAMGVGLPVVSTDVGDVAVMVADENLPFVVARNDLDGFTDALRTLIDDPGLQSRLGLANRRKCAEQFDLDLMIRNYFDLYEQVLTPNNPASRCMAGCSVHTDGDRFGPSQP
jgi:glycosyltransferase involved in cell wall biosynthesis